MLSSAGHEIFPAHKCENDNDWWHLNIYEQGNSILSLFKPKKAEFLDMFIVFMSI